MSDEPAQRLQPAAAMTRHPISERTSTEARRIIPGGHHLSGRPLLTTRASPQYFDHAAGCRLRDVDGNEYIDYLMAYGAIVLGYAHAAVDRAALEQVSRGALVSLNHPLHVRFIEALLSRFPFADMGVFVKTGSEATTAALRIARRATGRRKVIRSGYHGWHDWCLPLEPFVPAGLDQEILEYDARDPQALERLIAAHAGEVAAVIVAPEMVHPLERGPLARAIDITRRAGAVFVMDEVKTGFRVKQGSIHRLLDLRPDIVTLSKAMGNGWPVAAVLGTRDVMEHAAGMHLSATYHGDTAAMAAALRVLQALDEDAVPEHLDSMGARLMRGLMEGARHHGLPVEVYGEPVPAMPFMRFRHPDPRTNTALVEAFFGAALDRGVLLHPRHLWFVSQAHGPAEIDQTLDVCDAAFRAAKVTLGAL